MKRISEDNINTKEFWEKTWSDEPDYDMNFGIDGHRFDAMMAGLSPYDSVIDVGGGRGEFLWWLSMRGHIGEKTLVDLSEYACRYASE